MEETCHKSLEHRFSHSETITAKTFGLFQPYFGHLSCMPVVYVTHKVQGMLPKCG